MNELRAAGVELRVSLELDGSERALTDDVLERIRVHYAGLILLVADEESPVPLKLELPKESESRRHYSAGEGGST